MGPDDTVRRRRLGQAHGLVHEERRVPPHTVLRTLRTEVALGPVEHSASLQVREQV